jgi:hypothetical protein
MKRRTIAPLLLLVSTAWGGTKNVTQLQLEYRANASGFRSAVIHNLHRAAATAYIAEAWFASSGRDRRSAFGGDSLSSADGGGIEVPASSDRAMSQTLPRDAASQSTGFVAAVWADGHSEGDEDVVAMMLSGRQQSFKDLKECLPVLEKAARGETSPADLTRLFQNMQTRDLKEASDLDEMVAYSGLRYRFFMNAVPAQALNILPQGGGDAGQVQLLLEQFRAWKKRLEDSKPALK